MKSGSVFDFLFDFRKEDFSSFAFEFDNEACETVWRQFDLEGENPCTIEASEEHVQKEIETARRDFRFWSD